MPARIEYLFARCFELYAIYFAQYGCGGELTIRIENADKAACNEVEYMAFHVAQSLRNYAGRDDGMVIGHLRRVKYLLAFGQRFASQWPDEQIGRASCRERV